MVTNLEELGIIIKWHLENNFFPPLSAGLVKPAFEAIQAAERGEYDTLINLTESGITNQAYGELVPAYVLIDDLHLQDFIQSIQEGEL